MIARKITYYGKITHAAAGIAFDITRKNEIMGEVIFVSPDKMELHLEGDPSMIKLVQHQVERALKATIEKKEIIHAPYKHYLGVNILL